MEHLKFGSNLKWKYKGTMIHVWFSRDSKNVITLKDKFCRYLLQIKWKRLQQIFDSNEKVGINNILNKKLVITERE